MKYSLYKKLQVFVHHDHKEQKNILLRELNNGHLSEAKSSVLELACGGGNFAQIFPIECYTGIDLMPDRIAAARRDNAGYNFEVVNINGPRATELIKRANFIFCHGLLHHLNDQECRDLIKSVKQFSRKPSLFIVMEPILPNRWFNPLGFLIAKLDQGKYVRTTGEYLNLFSVNDLRIKRLRFFFRWPVDMEVYIIKC
ncbi:MAG: class I SAM-dependent methyltransferase [Candidatus Omnitrophica bacterium]|nr:class I SAM-dependent methyltransferase [Candidatus Omnitrophota bacterium]MBU1922901.1 class I SAM-dependent methyltransferase [Candidatus Omnitrophota bacterium]